ncbi:MAG: MerR family transcriptional regulator [Burkholderiales bacterium]
MFRIGDFSRIARVSCRLLRYYDELGLLKPVVVDRETGYRFYSASQLPQLNRILVLKELGLSLEQIGQIIDNNVSSAELRAMLLIRRADVEQALAAESDRLSRIETRISQIESEGHLSVDDVVIRDEPVHKILAVRMAVPSFSAARDVIRQLLQSVPRRIPKALLGPMIAIAHSPEFEPDTIDVEFGYILDGDLDTTVPLANGAIMRVRELASVERLAVCVRVGLPEDAHLITAKIGQFVEANGYSLAGPSREVFLQPPRLERMADSVVEMQFPIERAPNVSLASVKR